MHRLLRFVLVVSAAVAFTLGDLYALPAAAVRAQAGAVAPAQDLLAQIRRTGILRVGLTGDYDPFSVADASGSFHGLDVDAAGMLASAIAPNVKVEIVKTSWPTMTADLLAGKFDIAMGGVSRNKPRADAGELSRTYYVDGKVGLIRAADKNRFHGLADFDQPNVTVLVNPGGTNQQFVDANIKQAKIVVVQDNQAIPGMIADGKGDVMFTDGVEAKLKAAHDARLYVASADHPFTHIEKVYFLPKGQTALLEVVNAWIDKMQADGSYAKLWAKYTGKQPA